VLELCEAKCADGHLDFELRGNSGMTAAAVARAAGHVVLAEMIAEASKTRQLAVLAEAVSGRTGAATAYDSLSDRIMALFTSAGLPSPTFADDHDEFEANDDTSRYCVVCMDAPINAAVAPCFHAQYCIECAAALQSCAICRGRIERVQQIYLP
jgi:hypothetical protein